MARRRGASLLIAAYAAAVLVAAPLRANAPAHPPPAVSAALAHLAPRHGSSAVYFLGVAGYGEQRVFRRESELARRALGEHFDALDRSVELVNDVHDRSTYPLATRANLGLALRGIGQRMDRDRDVLVLLVTSHGSPDGAVALTNGRLLDDDLTPRELRRALDRAGIRWRIIILSACYAGRFIPALRSDTTLVMTAADARHSSFGCADDRALTYFGEALLHDALPGSCSLEDAFARARGIIYRRERAEHEIHSNPQLFMGRKMDAKLRQIERTPRTASCSSAHASAARAVRP